VVKFEEMISRCNFASWRTLFVDRGRKGIAYLATTWLRPEKFLLFAYRQEGLSIGTLKKLRMIHAQASYGKIRSWPENFCN
jgi:hypothetical protein